jgi:hypothetical protein
VRRREKENMRGRKRESCMGESTFVCVCERECVCLCVRKRSFEGEKVRERERQDERKIM